MFPGYHGKVSLGALCSETWKRVFESGVGETADRVTGTYTESTLPNQKRECQPSLTRVNYNLVVLGVKSTCAFSTITPKARGVKVPRLIERGLPSSLLY